MQFHNHKIEWPHRCRTGFSYPIPIVQYSKWMKIWLKHTVTFKGSFLINLLKYRDVHEYFQQYDLVLFSACSYELWVHGFCTIKRYCSAGLDLGGHSCSCVHTWPLMQSTVNFHLLEHVRERGRGKKTSQTEAYVRFRWAGDKKLHKSFQLEMLVFFTPHL